MRLGIERLAGARLVRSEQAAIALARLRGHQAVGVILDTYHLYGGVSKTEDLEALRATRDLLTFVHVSDVAGDKLHELWAVPDRELPLPEGAGGIPTRACWTPCAGWATTATSRWGLFSAAFESHWRGDPGGGLQGGVPGLPGSDRRDGLAGRGRRPD